MDLKISVVVKIISLHVSFFIFYRFFNSLLKETFQNGIFFALPVPNSLNTNLANEINQWPKKSQREISYATMKVQRQASAEALTSWDCSETVAELLLNQILYNRHTRFGRNLFFLLAIFYN